MRKYRLFCGCGFETFIKLNEKLEGNYITIGPHKTPEGNIHKYEIEHELLNKWPKRLLNVIS